MFGASSELANVMEFGFNLAQIVGWLSDNSCSVTRQVAREFTRLKSECRDEEIGE